MSSRLVLCCAVSFVGACGGSSSSMPDGSATADAAMAIEAPNEQWTYVELPGMKCGNGAATGVAVNLTNRSDRVAVFFQGGGACWDGTTCFVTKTSVNIESGYTASSWAAEAGTISGFYAFQRTTSPFADASWVYVPYCTGDLHDGERVATYDVSGAARMVHHVGGENADIIFSRMHATRPNAETVFVFGISAGGYGTAFNLGNAHRAWPNAKVHGLSDSSPLVKLEQTRWAAMQASWAMRFPAGCTTCSTDLGAMNAALAAETPAGDRWGLLTTTQDQTIGAYFGLTGPQLQAAVLAEQAAMSGDQAAFVVDATTHVLLTMPQVQVGGITLLAWVTQWATGDAAWANKP